jgi:hypothetical protein
VDQAGQVSRSHVVGDSRSNKFARLPPGFSGGGAKDLFDIMVDRHGQALTKKRYGQYKLAYPISQ